MCPAGSSAATQGAVQTAPAETPQEQAERFLRALHVPGDVFELRSLDCPGWVTNGKPGKLGTWSGHYRDPAAAAADAVRIDAKHKPRGFYVTVNPVRPDLLARGVLAAKDTTTPDGEIVRRRWLALDLDPERPKSIAATDAERAAALDLAALVVAELSAEGWPAPVRVGSGNGALLLWRIDLPADADALDLITRVLAGMGARFDTPAVHVDKAMCNASRIVRLPGTWNRKGTDFKGDGDISPRPHRIAELLDVPAALAPVSRELLELVAAPKDNAPPARGSAPEPRPRTMAEHLAGTAREFYRVQPTPESVRGYLEHFGATIKGESDKGGYHFFHLTADPVTGNESTGHNDISVSVGADTIAYNNLHNHGEGLRWIDVRDCFESGYREHAVREKARKESGGGLASSATAARGPTHPGAEAGTAGGAPEKEAPRLVAVSLGELLSLDIPPREFLMDPFLRRKDLCMVFGQRGHGKTWVGIGAACAVASGGRFNDRWRGRGAHKVLFVDGELPLEDVQEKFAVMVRAMGLSGEQDAALRDNLRIITPDNQPDLIPDLSTPEGQAAIEPHLDGVALVVLDNLSTLCGGAEENDSMAWLPMGSWLLSLRRRNMAVIFVHHAGRNNQARGHSKREDPLDHIIRVQQPPTAAPDSGAHLEVFFTKKRHKFDGKDAQTPFELKLDEGGSWLLKPLDRAQAEQVAELLDLKMSVRDIAQDLGLSKSAVQRIKSKRAGA